MTHVSVPRAPSAGPAPLGLGCVLGADTRVCDGGRTLLAGGSVLRLSEVAAGLVAAEPVGADAGPQAARLVRLLLDRGVADPCWPDPPPADADVRDVTVVVPVHDRPGEVARLLAALPVGLEVVVVDDASTDTDALVAVCDRPGVRLLRHDVNTGPAGARNTGLAAVTTPYVCFCDSDVVPVPGWLGVLRRHLDDPLVALVGPRVLGNEAGPGDGWLDRYEQARSALDLGPTPAAVRVHGRVAYLPSACVLARVGALGAGFDAAMRCGEDVDLVWRLLDAGWLVRFEPTAHVRHDHRTGLRDWWARKAFYGTSAAPLAARHERAVAPMVLSPWSLVLTLAALAQRRWSAPVAALTLAVTTGTIARRLATPQGRPPVRTAAVLTAEGAVASLWQTGSALTRHYWPLSLAACLVSRRARRAVVVASVVDGLADWRRVRPALDPARYVVARRLDDLGYGAGLWLGCLRSRSFGALVPKLTGLPSIGSRGARGSRGSSGSSGSSGSKMARSTRRRTG